MDDNTPQLKPWEAAAQAPDVPQQQPPKPQGQPSAQLKPWEAVAQYGGGGGLGTGHSFADTPLKTVVGNAWEAVKHPLKTMTGVDETTGLGPGHSAADRMFGAGPMDVSAGVQKAKQGDWSGALGDFATGAAGVASTVFAPEMGRAAYVAPAKFIRGLVTSAAGSYAAGKAAEWTGAPEGVQRAAEVAGGALPMAGSVRNIGKTANLPPLYEAKQGLNPGDLSPSERMKVGVAHKSMDAQNQSDWATSLNRAKEGVGFSTGQQPEIESRIMAIGAAKQLVPEQDWGHAPGNPVNKTEYGKLKDIHDYLDTAEDRASTRFQQSYMNTPQAQAARSNMHLFTNDVVSGLDPELANDPRSKSAFDRNISQLQGFYQRKVMSSQDVWDRVKFLNKLEYNIFNKDQATQSRTLDTNMDLAFMDSERRGLLDRLVNMVSTSDPDLARLERDQWGSIIQLRSAVGNQLKNVSMETPSIPRRSAQFLSRMGAELMLPGMQRGAIANLASGIATAVPVPEAGSKMAQAFAKYNFPYQLPMAPGTPMAQASPLPGAGPMGPPFAHYAPPGGPTGPAVGPGQPPGPGLPPKGPTWGISTPPLLGTGDISPAWPPGKAPSGAREMPGQDIFQMPPAGPPAGQKLLENPDMVRTMGRTMGRKPGSMPVMNPDTPGGIEYYTKSPIDVEVPHLGLNGEMPKGPYKAGDSFRNPYDGKTYVRDAHGEWKAQVN